MIIYNRTEYKELSLKAYQKEKRRLQIELLKLQEWVVKEKRKIAIVFEGRDAAGKGSTIKRFIEYMMPNSFRVVELGIPTPKENKYWFRRYEDHLPEPGEMVFFDRSWYTRALIQPTMGYCTPSQYRYFMRKVNIWEKSLIDEGIILIKIYLSITKLKQIFRFRLRKTHDLKYWKFSENDMKSLEKWDLFTLFKEKMFQRTSTGAAPWVIINSDNKMIARLNALRYVLSNIEYDGKQELKPKKWARDTRNLSIELDGVVFRGLSQPQYEVLYKYKSNA